MARTNPLGIRGYFGLSAQQDKMLLVASQALAISAPREGELQGQIGKEFGCQRSRCPEELEFLHGSVKDVFRHVGEAAVCFKTMAKTMKRL